MFDRGRGHGDSKVFTYMRRSSLQNRGEWRICAGRPAAAAAGAAERAAAAEVRP